MHPDLVGFLVDFAILCDLEREHGVYAGSRLSRSPPGRTVFICGELFYSRQVWEQPTEREFEWQAICP